MLSCDQLDLLWNIEIACQRCIRASHYFDIVSGTKANMWIFTQNCYGGICIIHWCQVFGVWSEPTHYSRLFKAGTVSSISKDQAADRLRKATGKDEHQYKSLWEEVKSARDKFLVHNEFSSKDRPVFPDLDILVKVCLEMRDIIREIVKSEESEDPKQQENIANFVSYYTNDRFLSEIKGESQRLFQAMAKG